MYYTTLNIKQKCIIHCQTAELFIKLSFAGWIRQMLNLSEQYSKINQLCVKHFIYLYMFLQMQSGCELDSERVQKKLCYFWL